MLQKSLNKIFNFENKKFLYARANQLASKDRLADFPGAYAEVAVAMVVDAECDLA